MFNWLTKLSRRYSLGETVRFFVSPRKGTGAGIVLTPDYRTGRVVGFDPVLRQYRVETDEGTVMINPRNLSRV